MTLLAKKFPELRQFPNVDEIAFRTLQIVLFPKIHDHLFCLYTAKVLNREHALVQDLYTDTGTLLCVCLSDGRSPARSTRPRTRSCDRRRKSS